MNCILVIRGSIASLSGKNIKFTTLRHLKGKKGMSTSRLCLEVKVTITWFSGDTFPSVN